MTKELPNKRRKITTSDTKRQEKFQKSSDFEPTLFSKVPTWDAEQDYEQQPREKDERRDNSRLPIRTADGWIKAKSSNIALDSDSIRSSDDSFTGFSSADGQDDEPLREGVESTTAHVLTYEQLLQAKEELAQLASSLTQDPEENIGALGSIGDKIASQNAFVRSLALGTQLVVFKDILPAYRIRENAEDDSGVKLSKDVRRLRQFEQSLLKNYRSYIRHLATFARYYPSRGPAGQKIDIGYVAVTCACDLALSVSHFNYRKEVLQILVEHLAKTSGSRKAKRARETLERLFETDEDGYASLEAVEMVTKMIKQKQYRVHESVLNTFLHLRLLSEFNLKASTDRVGGAEPTSTLKGKKAKQKREFRSKKERKQLKERSNIEKEMKEADAAVSHEERERLQGEVLKLVFSTYFRILKARTSKLMGAVLEGLARYSHLINQEFFGDILEVLRDLIKDTNTNTEALSDENKDIVDGAKEDSKQYNGNRRKDTIRESLLCIVTAFALLHGQDTTIAVATSLHLDLKSFIAHLYQNIYPLSLSHELEQSGSMATNRSDGFANSGNTNISNETFKVNAQTNAVLLIRALSSALLPPAGLRAVPPIRVAAFVKSLMTASLHLQEKPCQAMLALLQKVAKIHGSRIAALWYTEERRGNGAFEPLRTDAEGSNPFATTIWEGELLRRHYCPETRDLTRTVDVQVTACR